MATEFNTQRRGENNRKARNTNLEIDGERLGYPGHDGVDELALAVLLLAGEGVLLGDAALAEVDAALAAVDSEEHVGLDAAHPDEAADRADTAAGELGERDHALDVTVLQEGHVDPDVVNAANLYHHHRAGLRVLRLVHTALQVW